MGYAIACEALGVRNSGTACLAISGTDIVFTVKYSTFRNRRSHLIFFSILVSSPDLKRGAMVLRSYLLEQVGYNPASTSKIVII